MKPSFVLACAILVPCAMLASCGPKQAEVVEVPRSRHAPVVLAAADAACKSGVLPAADATPTVPKPTVDANPAPAIRLVPPGRPVLPPTEPGQAAWRPDGCLAVAKGSAEDDKKFPAEVTRSRQTDVQIAVTGVGAIVTHALRHACCLKGDVTARVRGTDIQVREVLTGEACRCMCASTLKIAVGLKPGTYTLDLVTVTGGTEEVVAKKPVEIR